MSIYIKQLKLRNAGPISSEQTFSFSPFTLVYGKNESGKTSMLEGLIRSLFLSRSSQSIYGIRGDDFKHMKAWVQMQVNGKDITYQTGDSTTLYDTFDSTPDTVPADLTDLLIARAGDVSFPGADTDLDKKTLHSFLSKEQTYTHILNTIQSSPLGKAYSSDFSLESKNLCISNRKPVKNYKDLTEKVYSLSKLLANLQKKDYGIISNLQQQYKELTILYEQQTNAKKHFAFTLHQDILQLNKKGNLLNPKDISQVRDNIVKHKELSKQYDTMSKDMQTLQETAETASWLDHAYDSFKTYMYTGKENSHKAGPIISTGAVLSIIISLFCGLFISKIFMLIFGISSIILFIISIFLSMQKRSTDTSGMDTLLNEIKIKTNKHIKTEADFKVLIDTVKEKASEYKILKKNASQNKQSREILSLNIIKDLNKISDVISSSLTENPDSWDAILRKADQFISDIEQQIQKKNIRLQILQVPQSEYIPEYNDTPFSAESHNNIEQKLSDVQNTLNTLKADKNGFLSELSRIAPELPPASSLSDYASNILDKHSQAINETGERSAEIIGGLLLSDVIKNIQKKQEQNLEDMLNTEDFAHILEDITKDNYEGLTIEDETIKVFGKGKSFKFSSLSTGARDQILLSLRLHLAEKISGKQTLFFLMDDTFQHSDWDRRKSLIKQLSKLVIKGWQVIYFTMDDNILELCNTAGVKLGTDKYSIINLGTHERKSVSAKKKKSKSKKSSQLNLIGG
jgi:uncharacterized protein YhaN